MDASGSLIVPPPQQHLCIWRDVSLSRGRQVDSLEPVAQLQLQHLVDDAFEQRGFVLLGAALVVDYSSAAVFITRSSAVIPSWITEFAQLLSPVEFATRLPLTSVPSYCMNSTIDKPHSIRTGRRGLIRVLIGVEGVIVKAVWQRRIVQYDTEPYVGCCQAIDRSHNCCNSTIGRSLD